MTTDAIQTSLVTAADGDPFRYGWRFVLRPTPDNPHHLEQVPLTLEDVLHPEVGDFIVHNDRHETDRIYLTEVLRARLESSGVAIVLTDVRIAWDIPGLRAHGPDVMVIPGIAERQNWSTFDVAVEGARPALIIEITSLETCENDLERKVEHYAQAGVAQYVIIDDMGGRNRERRLRLLDHRLADGRYVAHPMGADGRVHLVIAGLWLGIEGDHVVCYDAQGMAIGDYVTVVRQAAEAAERARRAEARCAARKQSAPDRKRQPALKPKSAPDRKRQPALKPKSAPDRKRQPALRLSRVCARWKRNCAVCAARKNDCENSATVRCARCLVHNARHCALRAVRLTRARSGAPR
jgi:colicin import membrane protein